MDVYTTGRQQTHQRAAEKKLFAQPGQNAYYQNIHDEIADGFSALKQRNRPGGIVFHLSDGFFKPRK